MLEHYVIGGLVGFIVGCIVIFYVMTYSLGSAKHEKRLLFMDKSMLGKYFLILGYTMDPLTADVLYTGPGVTMESVENLPFGFSDVNLEDHR